MKKIHIVLSAIVVIIFGFILYYNLTTKWHPGPSAIPKYKDIEGAQIPGKCVESKDDVCGLFDCMVDQCWCDESSPELPILYVPEGIMLANKEEASDLVEKFLKISDYKDYKVTNAVQLNNIFFNVFAENLNYDEITFTVAVDGTIIKTICGV